TGFADSSVWVATDGYGTRGTGAFPAARSGERRRRRARGARGATSVASDAAGDSDWNANNAGSAAFYWRARGRAVCLQYHQHSGGSWDFVGDRRRGTASGGRCWRERADGWRWTWNWREVPSRKRTAGATIPGFSVAAIPVSDAGAGSGDSGDDSANAGTDGTSRTGHADQSDGGCSRSWHGCGSGAWCGYCSSHSIGVPEPIGAAASDG